MRTIKTRTAVKDIKILDKSANLSSRMKNTMVRTKERAEETREPRSGSPTGSASRGFQDMASAPNAKMPDTPVGNTPGSGFPRPGYLSKGVKAPQSIGSTAESAGKSAKTIKSTAKGFKDTAKGTIKMAKKSVKTSERTAKQAVKTAQQAAKATVKGITAMVKATIAAAKGLIAAVAAGGWVAVLVIVIICMIGLLVGSIFGIFFANEPNPHTGQTASSVMAEIDAEYTGRIDNIIASNTHDSLEMSGARASWKELLAVYAVRTATDPDNPLAVAVMDDEKAAILHSVFWDMNAISYWTRSIEHSSSYIDEDGNEQNDTWTEYILHITVSRKTPVEMATQYRFTGDQKECLDELLKPEYISLWNTLLYGISGTGDGSMIEIAATQIGNVGGEPYWSWCGFGSREEWCACFVSWVAEQCGYIDAGIIPRFAWCPSGVQWFKDRDEWQDNGYTPRPGDIIFFDWEPDGECDHVGIVESVADGKVNTIEGNSGVSCRRRSYDLCSVKIYGYGVPSY